MRYHGRGANSMGAAANKQRCASLVPVRKPMRKGSKPWHGKPQVMSSKEFAQELGRASFKDPYQHTNGDASLDVLRDRCDVISHSLETFV